MNIGRLLGMAGLSSDFLSAEPISGEYLERLRLDLQAAQVIRFAVAYVSDDGLQGIGKPELLSLLGHPNSFGISSLTCRFGHLPLCGLQRQLQDSHTPKLKYFMKVGNDDNLRLIHDKLIYLGSPKRKRAVLYVGSHNWTAPALGLGRIRNVEASLRIEAGFGWPDLEGRGTGLMTLVNQHLAKCFNLPLCIPATDPNVPKFEEWESNVCESPPSCPLEQIGIVLAVLGKTGGQGQTANDWAQSLGKSLYLQCLEEEDGGQLRMLRPRILVFAWDSPRALSRADQPVILICRESTSFAGPESQVHGSNISDNVIEGFCAAVLDERQLASMQQCKPAGPARTVTLRTGRTVEFFDLQLPPVASSSRTLNRTVVPRYQYHLEIENVVLPDGERRSTSGILSWPRSSFAVSHGGKVKFHRTPGYPVDREAERAMLECLRNQFGIDTERATALPYSDWNDPRQGKRVTAHPFHECFLPAIFGPLRENNADVAAIERKHFGAVPAGFIAAEIDTGRYPSTLPNLIRRVFLAHAMPVSELRNLWQHVAGSRPAGT